MPFGVYRPIHRHTPQKQVFSRGTPELNHLSADETKHEKKNKLPTDLSVCHPSLHVSTRIFLSAHTKPDATKTTTWYLPNPSKRFTLPEINLIVFRGRTPPRTH